MGRVDVQPEIDVGVGQPDDGGMGVRGLVKAVLSEPSRDFRLAPMVGMAASTHGAVEQPSKSLPPMEMVTSLTALVGGDERQRRLLLGTPA